MGVKSEIRGKGILMTYYSRNRGHLLLLIAGAKGAIGSTIAAAVSLLQSEPERILPSLITREGLPGIGPAEKIRMAGWDLAEIDMEHALQGHGVVPAELWKDHVPFLDQIPVLSAPPPEMGLKGQTEHLISDIRDLLNKYPHSLPVLVNLLPSCAGGDLQDCRDMAALYAKADPKSFPDLAYGLAAVRSGVPVVNFTPNPIEVPALVQEAIRQGVPISGRDGKTGQTYLKIVLASALKARALHVDGWYSLNILGNADGKNLMDPACAKGKLANKTEILDEILGYSVGERYGTSTHKVHIDYYPPRGDAKEAWDVIDFNGIFGMPMSLRLNLQGRDSILAAPMILDLARWTAAAHKAGLKGLIPELAFFYKRPLGDDPPLTFQDQMVGLQQLEEKCR